MRALLAAVALLAAGAAVAQHKPWFIGTQGTGAGVCTNCASPIARDSGSFPVLAGSGTPGSSLTTATFSTTNANTLIVVAAAWGHYSGTVMHPLTVAWSGGTGCNTTFTKQVERAWTGTSANVAGASIWTAACTSTVNSRSIVVTAQATGGVGAVMVDALTGASSTMGLSGGNASASGSSVAVNVTLNPITSGSWIYVAGTTEDTANSAPVTNTTERNEYNNGSDAFTGANETGTSGSINVGWSQTAGWSSVAALEIKQGT